MLRYHSTYINFNPRPLHGERASSWVCRSAWFLFQSTPPTRGATSDSRSQAYQTRISIHAPYIGSDTKTRTDSRVYVNFNPRPLHEERPFDTSMPLSTSPFQSTPPTRGATQMVQMAQIIDAQFQSTPPTRGATAT